MPHRKQIIRFSGGFRINQGRPSPHDSKYRNTSRASNIHIRTGAPIEGVRRMATESCFRTGSLYLVDEQPVLYFSKFAHIPRTFIGLDTDQMLPILYVGQLYHLGQAQVPESFGGIVESAWGINPDALSSGEFGIKPIVPADHDHTKMHRSAMMTLALNPYFAGVIQKISDSGSPTQ